MDYLSIITENENKIAKIILSDTNLEVKKIIIRPVGIKGKKVFQLEKYVDNQVFHQNLTFAELKGLDVSGYNQILIQTFGTTYQLNRNNDKYKCKKMPNDILSASLEHNKVKKYILDPQMDIPVLIDLGLVSSDHKLIKSKADKFRQIEKFIEIIDEAFKENDLKEITILDFGCGKSYLTFIMYYYFQIIKGVKAKIIGYDLKKDVVDNCNKLAKKYKYNGLEFHLSDVTKDELYKGKIDMVISLHACDIATDYALNFAIKNKVRYIFSVPCCQHEVNLSIKGGGDFDLLLKDGLIKERFSALLTDAVRIEVLRSLGYSVDVIEFVDFSHTPKNIMLRAKLNSKKKSLDYVKTIKEKYGFNQTLFNLVNNEK